MENTKNGFLTRARYKEVKKMDRKQMEEYIKGIYKLGLSDGATDVIGDTTFPKLDMDMALEGINKVLHSHAKIAVGGKRFDKMKDDLQSAIEDATNGVPVGSVEIKEVKGCERGEL